MAHFMARFMAHFGDLAPVNGLMKTFLNFYREIFSYLPNAYYGIQPVAISPFNASGSLSSPNVLQALGLFFGSAVNI